MKRSRSTARRIVPLLVAGVVLDPGPAALASTCPPALQLQARRNDQYLVRAVYPGSATTAEADPPVDSAYIELRTPHSGQTSTNLPAPASKVEIYGPTGTLKQTVALTVAGASVANASILIGAAGFATTFGSNASWRPDMSLTSLGLDLRGGKVCYRSGDASNPFSDCVAWGNYSGAMGTGGDRVGAPFRPLYGLRRGEAIERRECDNHVADANDSASDFIVAAPNPRNKDGYTASMFSFPVRGTCGNDVLEGIEECDEGARNGDIDCLTTCRLAVCGDLVVQPNAGETCEPPGTDSCTASCELVPAECGDTRLDEGEECDDGNNTPNDGCAPNCELERCGDGDLQPGGPRFEECDDGDTESGDGCSATCKTEFCGDRVVQAALNETCDDGNQVAGDGCGPGCRAEVCGDGITQSGPPRNEECDDANQVVGDGCNNFCKEEFCGDGIRHATLEEACDDGNDFNDDDCSNDCRVNRCGDGIHQERRGEECDDGNQSLGDGCTPSCVREFCGDRVVQESLGEECDDGNELDDDGCSPLCQLERCGDGIVQRSRGEQCDDRNTRDGDGCTRTCKEERCGDGVRQAALNEACDDGNEADGDGCSAACEVEVRRRSGCASAGTSLLGLAGLSLLARRRRRAHP